MKLGSVVLASCTAAWICLAARVVEAGGGFGSVWADTVASDSIKLDWSDPSGDYRYPSTKKFKVCWEKDGGWWENVCNNGGTEVEVTTKPYTVEDLECGASYKFRVMAYTEHKGTFGKWHDADWHKVGTLTQSTSSCSSTDPTGTLIIEGADDERFFVTVTWDPPAGYDLIRIGYKRTFTAVELEKHCEKRDGIEWLEPDYRRGWWDIEPAVALTEHLSIPREDCFALDPCRDYKLVAYAFPTGSNDGVFIGEARGRIDVSCKSEEMEDLPGPSGPALDAPFKLGQALLADHESVLESYAQRLSFHYDAPTPTEVLGGTDGAVHVLTTFDDGTGEALYVGGQFTSAGELGASHVARWDGIAWRALGGGTDGTVRLLATFDDGRGPALYAAGDFLTADGEFTGHVARWDGGSWSSIGAEALPPFAPLALCVFDDGSGAALFVSLVNGTLWRWDGATWTSINMPPRRINSMVAADMGFGPRLFGAFATPLGGELVSTWDGLTWTPTGFGFAGVVAKLVTFDDGTGPLVVAGGRFETGGPGSARNVAAFDGVVWRPLASGVGQVTDTVVRPDEGCRVQREKFRPSGARVRGSVAGSHQRKK